MIVFDLRCGGGHVFEAWFASTAAYEEQRDRRLVACPMCGDHAVEKAVMAPRVGAKGNAVSAPDRMKAALAEIAAAQGRALKDSRWVGKGFAEGGDDRCLNAVRFERSREAYLDFARYERGRAGRC